MPPKKKEHDFPKFGVDFLKKGVDFLKFGVDFLEPCVEMLKNEFSKYGNRCPI